MLSQDLTPVLLFSYSYTDQEVVQTFVSQLINPGLTIQLVTPTYFIATKLEAYKGRGNNDPMQSRDIEDILNVFDGREEVIEEIKQSQDDVKEYISEELKKLLDNQNFEYAVQSTAQNQAEREALIFERLEDVSG